MGSRPSTGPAGTIADPEDEHIRRSTLALVHARTPAILTANLLNSVLTALVFYSAISPRLVALWLAVFVSSLAARLALWARFRDQTQPDWLHKWQQVAEIGSYSGGLMWGAAGFFFFVPDSPVHLAVLVFVLGGMAAGALTTLSAHLRALRGYLLLSVSPFCLRLFMEGRIDSLAMAVMAVLFIVLLLVIGRQTHEVIARSFALRFENRELIRSLEQRVDDRTHRHAAVVEFSHRALSGLDTDSLLRGAASIVADGLPATTALVTEWVAQGEVLSVRAAAGPLAGSLGQLRLAVDPGSPAGHALRTGEPAISADGPPTRGFDLPQLPRDLGVVSTISVPIWGQESPFGVLEAWSSEPRAAAADDVNFVRAVATTIATALERRRAEEGLQRLALHDVLTGLPNRVLFHDRLDRAISHANRSAEDVALLLIDIDHFKDINDTLGHAAGDRLLAIVAERMRDCTRKDEPPARLGGDEFGILLTGPTSPDNAATVAEKLVNVLKQPVSVSGHELHVGASVGITIFPNDGGDPDHLLRNADLALYRAKAQGRGTYAFFSLDMAREVQDRIALLHDLRGAIAGRELYLEYQPQVALESGRLTGVESLLRWTSPRVGVVGPDTFIPMAETSGLIASLGDWTMRQACEQGQAWSRAGLPRMTIGVNVSLAQWRRNSTAEVVERVLAAWPFEKQWLELEITERAFLGADDRRLLECLGGLRQEGVSISIDDFGTGYSNLARLQQLPVDRIKVDGSFIAGLGRDTNAEIIVRAIIALSRSLGLQVVAEGVEHRLQLDFLRAEGCDVAQGYFLGGPMRAEHLLTLLTENPPLSGH